MHYFDNYGWLSLAEIPGRSTDVDPGEVPAEHVVGQPWPNFTGEAWVLCEYVDPLPLQERPAAVPQAVSMRQARLALRRAGVLAGVAAAIAALPEPERTDAEIEWTYSNEVQRYNGFVAGIGPALGLTEQQTDDLFRLAATL